jgi:uncharacterized protein (DUF305 family)
MRSSFTAALAAVCILGGPAASAQQPGGTGMPGASSPMHQSMMLGMHRMQSLRPTGDTDRDFATMMREHYRQAIEMARTQLEHGRSDEMKTLANKIIDDQSKELAQIDEWLARRK